MDFSLKWAQLPIMTADDDSFRFELIFCNKPMYRVKQLLGGRLSLRNYNAQVGETYAMIKALNKLTGLGMPETQCIV